MYKKTTTTVEEYFDAASQIAPQIAPQVMPPFPFPEKPLSGPYAHPFSPLALHPSARPIVPLAIDPKAFKLILRLDVPLMLKLLEYAKESAVSDTALHQIVEKMIDLCDYGKVLEMEDYSAIIEATAPVVPPIEPPVEPPVVPPTV
jgi:hypothetical protein